MTIYPGRVVNGHVEIDVEDADLPEGAEVSVYLHSDEKYTPTPEEAEEIEAALEEAELGGGMPAEEVIRELRALEETLRRG